MQENAKCKILLFCIVMFMPWMAYSADKWWVINAVDLSNGAPVDLVIPHEGGAASLSINERNETYSFHAIPTDNGITLRISGTKLPDPVNVPLTLFGPAYILHQANFSFAVSQISDAQLSDLLSERKADIQERAAKFESAGGSTVDATQVDIASACINSMGAAESIIGGLPTQTPRCCICCNTNGYTICSCGYCVFATCGSCCDRDPP